MALAPPGSAARSLRPRRPLVSAARVCRAPRARVGAGRGGAGLQTKGPEPPQAPPLLDRPEPGVGRGRGGGRGEVRLPAPPVHPATGRCTRPLGRFRVLLQVFPYFSAFGCHHSLPGELRCCLEATLLVEGKGGTR